MAPLTECFKSKGFWCEQQQYESFEAIKNALTMSPVLALSNFNKPLKVDIDAFGIGIRAVLE